MTFGGIEPRAWRARERERITGVWGGAPSGGPGGRAPGGGEADDFFYVWTSSEVRLLCDSYVLGVNHKGFSE